MIAFNIFVLYFSVGVVTSQNTESCFGDNEGLSCTKTNDCPWFQTNLKIYKGIAKNTIEKAEKLTELKSKVCRKFKPRKVCCPIPTTPSPTTPTTTTSTTTTTSPPPIRRVDNSLPSWIPSGETGECGLDVYSEFIVGGEITKIGEHPWAVLLGKQRDGQNKWHCGGTLINRWYVVSAAHCSPKEITMVRVGEWKVVDTSKPDRKKGIKFSNKCKNRRNCKNFRLVNGTYDCMDTVRNEFIWPEDVTSGNAVCAPPHQDILVDRVIVHPNYHRLTSGMVVNDIVLVKLQYPVQLSDYVAPACLPTAFAPTPTILRDADLGEKETALRPVVIGWGRSYDSDYNETKSVASAFQQKLELPVVNNKDCSNIWSKKFKVNLRGDIRKENHLCAGGEADKDSCKGDSGGPLVIRESDGDPTYLVGVVSAGTNRCGIGAPAIFTRITTLVNWIVENLN